MLNDGGGRMIDRDVLLVEGPQDEETGHCDECNKPYQTASNLDHCAIEGLCWDHCIDSNHKPW